MMSAARQRLLLAQPSVMLALLMVFTVNGAQAACKIGRFEFDILKNSSVDVELAAGDACASRLDFPGLQIQSTAVPVQPKNGHVNIEGAVWKYIPHAYYRGQDSFVIEIKGTDRRNKSGTSKMTFNVSVR